jgi:hypothetical protein
MEPAVLPRPPLTRRCLALPVPLCRAVLCAPIGSPSRCTDSRSQPIPSYDSRSQPIRAYDCRSQPIRAYGRFPVTIPAHSRFALTIAAHSRFALTADSQLRLPLTADSQLRFRLTPIRAYGRFPLTIPAHGRFALNAAVRGCSYCLQRGILVYKDAPEPSAHPIPPHPIPYAGADRRCGRSSHACR